MDQFVWTTDAEVFEAARRELFTAVVGDIMDKLGFRHQFLPPQIQPLARDMVVAGRAMTVQESDIAEGAPAPSRPFGKMLEALDDLRAGEVYLCTGASLTYALWGELMSTRAKICKAAGAVLDGYSRDTKPILQMGFPVFSRGSYAQDQGPRGHVTDYRVPIRIGGVVINPGDIVFGDMDGVCVVPSKAERDILAGAFEKARAEKTARKALEAGMNARQVFELYGIL